MQYVYLGGLVNSLYWLLSILLTIVILAILGGLYYEPEKGEEEAVRKGLRSLFWVALIITLILVFLPSHETMRLIIATKQ